MIKAQKRPPGCWHSAKRQKIKRTFIVAQARKIGKHTFTRLRPEKSPMWPMTQAGEGRAMGSWYPPAGSARGESGMPTGCRGAGQPRRRPKGRWMIWPIRKAGGTSASRHKEGGNGTITINHRAF